jgi:ribosomal-protein-alanine N-acetyltransferase
MTQPIYIRWMIRRDIDSVIGIDWLSYVDAWSEEDFLRKLRQRNCIGLAAEQGETVVGYHLCKLHKSYLRILRLAVHPDNRRKGVGCQLIAKLISKLESHRRTKLVLDVSEANLGGHLFLKANSFKAKPLRGADEYRFVYTLPGREASPVICIEGEAHE